MDDLRQSDQQSRVGPGQPSAPSPTLAHAPPFFLQEPALRVAAHTVEQTASEGLERAHPGHINASDLERVAVRIDELLACTEAPDRRHGLVLFRRQTMKLASLAAQTPILVYVDESLWRLEPRLRSAAIEIDFSFGDRDGSISPQDLVVARSHYAQVRGPVGWNRQLVTDELERALFPERTLRRSLGLRLQPKDWMKTGQDPLARLAKVSRYLDDAALARTYADIAARLACLSDRATDPLGRTYDQALRLLGQEIKARDSVRPSMTDIARVGCEDPEVKRVLKTPIDMARRLQPLRLLDPYL